MSDTRIYWLHALTPVHTGIGRGVGYIDLPLDRDGLTGWPVVRGSAFKGVWARHCGAGENARKNNKHLRAAFGLVGDGADGNDSNAGALVPTDARLVCLPVRSFRGTFAWCTSSLCLQMLRRTLELAGMKDPPLLPAKSDEDVACHTSETAVVEDSRVFLEDLDFKAQNCISTSAWADKLAEWIFAGEAEMQWRTTFQKRFVVLPDAAFDFLCETGTEVQTRVRISDDTKTVADKALWTEESLPSETILGGLVQCSRIFGCKGEEITPAGLLNSYANDFCAQVGGKATVGRGQVRCIFADVKGGGQ